MTATQIELYNFPATFTASAEARESGIRVVVEDTATPFGDLLKDTSSLSKNITWSSYNMDGMTAVRHMAYALAEQLRNNQFGAQK